MYLYVLLLICTVSTAYEDPSLWSILENIVDMTHETHVPEDARLNITQLAQKYQYPLEEHTVITNDGYILNLHRIPNHKDARHKPVVLLMHGILESSVSWLLMGPNKALGYVLADKGYDVWMGNCRGNKHAHTHINLNYTMTEYWEYSWEEIALYDLPAMIDHILAQTGRRTLYYIGHSQGTTIGYVLCSLKPEYNHKIRIMYSLAPVAWMGHVKSPIVRMFSPAHNLLGFMLSSFNTYATGMDGFKKISSFVCSVFPGKCDNIFFSLSGYETKVKKNFLSVILGHWPSGSSTLQFVHYGQLVESQRFCRYDFGHESNMMTYGRSSPPDYDLSRVTVPVVLFYSPKDWLSDPQDVLTLKHNLANVIGSNYLEDFTHIDYVYATDAVDYIYGKIIRQIDKFENSLKF